MKTFFSFCLIINVTAFSQADRPALSGKKINIAVLDFEAEGITESESRTLTNKLRGELVKTGKFNVIERGQMNAVLEEQEFQQTECAGRECAVEIGQLLGVERIIAGSVGKIENTFLISVRMIDVGKGNIIKHVDEEITGSLTDVMKAGIHKVAWKAAGLDSGVPEAAPGNKAAGGSSGRLPPSGSTEVWFVNLPFSDHLYLDHKTKMLVGGEKNDRMKKSLTAIRPGRHIMHYDRSSSVRYYSEFECREGENHLEPVFIDHRLPGISRHITWSEEKGKNRVEASKTAEYFLYHSQDRKEENRAELWFSVDMHEKPAGSDKLAFTYRWKVKLNGKVISEDQIREIRSMEKPGTHRKKAVIYSDKYHFYAVSYYIIRKSTELDLSAGYIEYMDK